MLWLYYVWNYIVKITERCKQLSLWITSKCSVSLLRKSGNEYVFSFTLKSFYLKLESENTYVLKEQYIFLFNSYLILNRFLLRCSCI
jgi:hypothetical protein